MPLSLPSLDFAIVCEEEELELYDVNLEDPSSVRAFVASEAGKQFKVKFANNLFDLPLSFHLYIDGARVSKTYMPPLGVGEVRGIYRTTSSILPFKFQELELVDPDLEHAPVVADMGTMELRAFRSRMLGTVEYIPSENLLHQGRISERSKKAGWHHVGTADEEFVNVPRNSILADYIDPPDVPFVSIKIFYRPRELLRAQGVITGPDVGAQDGQGSGINDKKRPREVGLSATPGPSKRPTVKKEDNDTRGQRIRALQAELSSLKAEQSGSSVKRELRSPSPIVVGTAAGEVIDLTLED